MPATPVLVHAIDVREQKQPVGLDLAASRALAASFSTTASTPRKAPSSCSATTTPPPPVQITMTSRSRSICTTRASRISRGTGAATTRRQPSVCAATRQPRSAPSARASAAHIKWTDRKARE